MHCAQPRRRATLGGEGEKASGVSNFLHIHTHPSTAPSTCCKCFIALPTPPGPTDSHPPPSPPPHPARRHPCKCSRICKHNHQLPLEREGPRGARLGKGNQWVRVNDAVVRGWAARLNCQDEVWVAPLFVSFSTTSVIAFVTIMSCRIFSLSQGRASQRGKTASGTKNTSTHSPHPGLHFGYSGWV